MIENAMRRPVPRATSLSEPFWDACRRHILTVQKCSNCNAYVFIPQNFCPQCLGTELSWVRSDGEGTIVSYTVVWRAQTPAFDTPYVVAIIRLNEGYEMLTNLVGVDQDSVLIGAKVRVTFVEVGPSTTLPCFQLA